MRRGVDGEAGGGEAERNRGQAGTAARLAVSVWKWPEDASDNEPIMRLARELHRPEGTCDCVG